MEPITREEMYLAAAAGYDITPPEPITRKEFFLAKLAGMDVPIPATFSREEMFLDAVAQRSPAAVIEVLNVTENGIYTAGNGVDGYSPVTVDIPDPVLQDKTITENGTYTADEGFDGLGEIIVNVMQNTQSQGALIKTKSIKLASQIGVRVDMDIGFVPDILFVHVQGYPTRSGAKGVYYFGTRQGDYEDKYGHSVNQVMSDGNSYVYLHSLNYDITAEYDENIPISAADATGFNLGKIAPFNNAYYVVYAIGGLT